MADRGHELTDEKIKKMEDELRKEYTQAAAEIENKLKDYMDRFTKKDAIWQKWVQEGKKTPEEYAKWRTGQMAVGKRWEKMKDSIADDLLHVNDIATGIVTGQMPEIFATNANYAIYSAESDAGIDTGLTLYNRDAVNAIIQDEPDLLLPPGQKVSAEIAAGTAKRWEREKIQSVMLQGILQGESIPNIARRLAEKVADSNCKAAVRNARTLSTNAQNLGRYHAYERLEKRGVGVTLEWAATLDNRTRHEHRMMHGQRRNVGEPFDVEGIKIMYPAQTGKFMGVSDIPQRMIWNCRCTILAWVKGYEHDTITKSDKMGDMTFEEWLKAKEQSEPILKQKEKGDAISGAFNKQYAGRPVGPARPLGSGYTYTPPEPDHGPEPEKYQYHATRRSSLVGIAEKGLKPNRGHFGKGVYLADSEEDAREWTSETSTGGKTILRVKEKFLKDGDFEKYSADESGYDVSESIFKGVIPLREIEIKINNNGDEDDWISLAQYIYNNKGMYNSLNKKTQKEIDKILHDEFVESERRRKAKEKRNERHNKKQ